MSNRLEVRVEGIVDASLVAEIETTIRQSFRDMSLPGAWRVIVGPSAVTGRWDFRVYGLNARHTLSITVPPSLLPSLIPRRLRESLNQSGSSFTSQTPEALAIAHLISAAPETTVAVRTK